MEHTEWLKRVMPSLMSEKIKGKTVLSESEEDKDKIIADWANMIRIQSQKKLIPLFITGSGVSMPHVPDINRIIEELDKKSKEKRNKEIENLFHRWKRISKDKKDRSIVANLLNALQKSDDDNLEEVWTDLNKWLLQEILQADPTDFHTGLAELYENYGALCLTLNFDGLLVRALIDAGDENKKVFSLPTEYDCEKYFLRYASQRYKELIEIQIRGDILYLECNNKGFCSQKGKGPVPLWNVLTISELKQLKDKSKVNEIIEKSIKCPACNGNRKSYLSFPGAYEKEKDMRKILEVVWKYLAFQVGSITVVGMSGEWDPLVIAFIGDMLSERNVPLLVVDKFADNEKTYVIRELVTPRIHHAVALQSSANEFMNTLITKVKVNKIHRDISKTSEPYDPSDDEYWYQKVKTDNLLERHVNSEQSELEKKLLKKLKEEKLQYFAQLGLKSRWLGIANVQSQNHSRFNHSKGVMKIASFLYDKAIENSGLAPNPNERQFLRAAALLHDIGHIPFSHLIEDVFKELKWRPAGYKNKYSHVFQTEEKVKKIFKEDATLRSNLYKMGYSVADLIHLINGSFGVGFLDAIINSAIDADKIDYIFRDTDSVKKTITLKPIDFLRDFTAEDSFQITPDKFLVIKGRAAKAAYELLRARKFLYDDLYRKPGIVVLEGLVKLIIKTYFVHVVRIESELNDLDSTVFPDLGHYKIMFCTKEMEKLFNDTKSDIEYNILKRMVEELNTKSLNKHIKDFITRAFEKIEKTNSEESLKELETDIDSLHFPDQKGKKDALGLIIKDCTLRMPGKILIDIDRTVKFLSVSDSRGEKERSDGTRTFSECILVPSAEHNRWNIFPKTQILIPLLDSSLKKIDGDRNILVYFYPVTGEQNYREAKNLFDKLLQ